MTVRSIDNDGVRLRIEPLHTPLTSPRPVARIGITRGPRSLAIDLTDEELHTWTLHCLHALQARCGNDEIAAAIALLDSSAELVVHVRHCTFCETQLPAARDGAVSVVCARCGTEHDVPAPRLVIHAADHEDCMLGAIHEGTCTR